MLESDPRSDRAVSRAKARRQLKILEIVRERMVSTQEDLADRLRAEGLSVTQATISRDIKDLGLVKAVGMDGRQHYATDARHTALDQKLMRICRDSVLSIEQSENMIVVHTLPATAEPVCEAIDSLHIPEVIGSMAGERNVFLVVRPAVAAERVADDLRVMLL